MKTYIFLAMLSSLASCSSKSTSKQTLIGTWEAESLNGSDLVDEGFDWVTLSFSNDSLEVRIHLHSKANLETISRGKWNLDGQRLTIDWGTAGRKEVHLDVYDGELVFTPDVLLKDKAISTYRPVRRDSAQQGLLR
ncbi:MAG: hypothetical protein EOP04_09310 [Proteobacteria bacterium]|nr:MAG: hypothetical protein EOP04_09310 [Pseudomonadota bacterium]